VGDQDKMFVHSELFYGTKGSVAFPDTIVDLTLKFKPNVVIPGGSIIRITLPGFTYPFESVLLRSPPFATIGEADLSDIVSHGRWDAAFQELFLDVPVRFQSGISRTSITVMRVLAEDAGFRLPITPLAPNDRRLTIAVVENQIIRPQPIAESPQVVARGFAISEFEYFPPTRKSIFMLTMRLQPTVNITDSQDIIIELPGFNNTLRKVNIQIMGEDRYRIRGSAGIWRQEGYNLTLKLLENTVIEAFTILNLRIEESQGFQLPASLNSNDTRLRISSIDNIVPSQAIRSSPMVGDGPEPNHMFCMFKNERGVHTINPICPTADAFVPPLTDPCSESELQRCGCEPTTPELLPVKIEGFQLLAADQIGFLEETVDTIRDPDGYKRCRDSPGGGAARLNFFSSSEISVERDAVYYANVLSIETGYFRICMRHDGIMFSAGFVVVRPSCRSPEQVLVDGTCVEHCPKTKIPIAGACKRDSIARTSDIGQAYMLAVKMHGDMANGALSTRDTEDAERRYFVYRYTYELARLLNADPTRIVVVSLSNGSIIINTVFQAVDADADVESNEFERSPLGLISLLRALQKDTSSTMYESPFFTDIDRDFLPPPIPVRLCPDEVYRVFCPYTGTVVTAMIGSLIFAGSILGGALIFALICFFAWRIDSESKDKISEDDAEKVQRDWRLVPPPLQEEYAYSWLQGRFMGENWEKSRRNKYLALEPEQVIH
jgi:hypothetical protein